MSGRRHGVRGLVRGMKAKLAALVVLIALLSVVADLKESGHLSTDKEVYLPGETIHVEATFQPKEAYILTPVGIEELRFEKRGKRFLAEYPLRKNVVLGKYVIRADNAEKVVYVDNYSILASVEGGKIEGRVNYYALKPQQIGYLLLPKNSSGRVKVGKNGSFVISLEGDVNAAVLQIQEAGLKLTLPVKRGKGVRVGKVHFPGEVVRLEADFKPKEAFVVDPLGRRHKLHFEKRGNVFVAELELKKDVVLGEYLFFADGLVKKFYVDFYSISAGYFNGTLAGNVSYYFAEPEEIRWKIGKLKGKSRVANGSFAIPVELPSGNYTAVLSAGNARLELNISIRRTILVRKVYFAGESVEVRANFMPHLAYIATPDNRSINLSFTEEEGGYYLAEVPGLTTLGNYSLVVDSLKRSFAVDNYSIRAGFVRNVIFGRVNWSVLPPRYVNCTVLEANFSVSAPVVNGSFSIPLNLSPGNYTAVLSAGNAKLVLNVSLERRLSITPSYDPVAREVVVKVEGDIQHFSPEELGISPVMKFKKLVRSFGKHTFLELRLPATNLTLKRFNLPPEVLNTTLTVKKLSDTKLRVELSNKLDVWYRFRVKIPPGYRVKEIVGDDGRRIVNNLSIDRLTGEVSGEIRWYVSNGTLYFYDDPIWGYDITLTPPAPNNSIAIELAYDGPYAGSGQISAIVFPYSQGDDSTTIAQHDHAGRTEDNGYGNNIDIDAGSKIALKFKRRGNTLQYGNDYYYWYRTCFVIGPFTFCTPYSATFGTLGTDGNLIQLNRTDVALNTVPDGTLESVVITDMQTERGEANITQKVIIRDNNRWFATVYYIKPGTDLTNLRFFQGMDWNFAGSYTGDNAYYDSTNDIVYGYDSNAPAGNIQYGGYGSDLGSSAHDVNYYTDYITRYFGGGGGTGIDQSGMWGDIYRDALNNATSFTGDAATALAWDRASLAAGETWVVPIIWGLGYNFTDMVEQINAGKAKLYDVGINSIDSPANDSKLNPNVVQVVNFNATAALYGLVDQENVNITINITKLGGGYSYQNYTYVNLSVPFNETAQVSFPVNISYLPYGDYNVTIATNLNNDQNRSNDIKWIIIHIVAFTVEPDQAKTGIAGEEVLYNISAGNYFAAGRFDVNITRSTKGWATRLYNGSTLLAEDTDGDSAWDYIAPGYDTNANGLVDLFLPYGDTNLTVSKVIPYAAPLGEVDHTTLEFVSLSDPTVSDDVTLSTSTPPPPSQPKTFYLHGDLSLNTSRSGTASSSTAVEPNTQASWYQSPAFADDFTISGKVRIYLWLNSSSAGAQHTVTVSLLYTDGVTSTVLGTNSSRFAPGGAPSPHLFEITLSSPTTIPRNNYLVLRVENTQTGQTLYVHHTPSYNSNITLNTTTYVKVVDIATDKGAYLPGETVTIYANVTDPIGSYDIVGANITVLYPNGTLYVSDSMSLNSTDPSTPPLWKTFSYSLPLPEAGVYQVTVTGIESNGVTSNLSINISAFVHISGRVFEDFGVLGVPYNSSEDAGIPNVTLAIFRDDGDGVFNSSLDTLVNTTTTNATGDYTFAVGEGTYFIAVNSRTVNTTQGLNPDYSQQYIWAEQTFQVEWNGSAFVNSTKFGGINASVSDDWSAGIYEHVAKVNASAYAGESIDFGFSFNLVVNTRDGDDAAGSPRSVQGSLRQFILNSNAIAGEQRSIFKIPKSDPGHVVEYVNSTPIEVWRISLTGALPQLSDKLVLNASTQEGNSSSIPGRIVGVDRYAIPDYTTPRVEVNGSSDIFLVNGTTARIVGFSLYTSAGSAVKVVGNGSSAEVRDSFLGTYANGSIAPAGYYGISVGNYYSTGIHEENLSAKIVHSIVAGFAEYGVVVNSGNLANATVEECLIYSNGGGSAISDGISLQTGGSRVVHSYIAYNRNNGSTSRIDGGAGVEVAVTSAGYAGNEVINNTVVSNARWGVAVLGDYARAAIKYNVIQENDVGIMVGDAAFAEISENSIFNSTRVGIDLDTTGNSDGDGVTLNDGLVNASQPNHGIDYPVITKAYLNASELYVEGFIGSESIGASSAFGGASIEVFLVRNSTSGDDLQGNNFSAHGLLPSYYGEGWLYLGRLTAGADGRFNGSITIAGKGVEELSYITATASLPGYGTSEFGRDYRLGLYPRNVSASISITGNKALINVTAFSLQHGVYVYWLAPANISITSMSGDYDSYASLGELHRWGFDVLRAGETRQVRLNLSYAGSFSTTRALMVGVDPQ